MIVTDGPMKKENAEEYRGKFNEGLFERIWSSCTRSLVDLSLDKSLDELIDMEMIYH